MFWNEKPVQFFWERCWELVMGCQENESCSKVLNFLERPDDRIWCTHEKTVAVVKLWGNIKNNKSLGCIFSEKPADWTNAFKLEMSSLADFYDSFESIINPRFLAESKKGMLWEPRVIKSGREMVEGFKEDEKGKRRAVLSLFSLGWFSVIHVFISSVHALSSLVRLVTSLRGVVFWSCVSSEKSWWFTEWLAISERGVVYRTKRMGPSSEPWGTLYMSCDGDELLTEVDLSLRGMTETTWIQWTECQKEFRQKRRTWWSLVSKAAERSSTGTEMLLSREEKILFKICNKMVSVLCPAQQADWKGLLRLFSWRLERGLWKTTFFKDFGQKWKVRYGAVVFKKIFVKWWLFQQRFDNGSLQIMWYNASGKRCADDVHDGRQEDVKVFMKKRGGNGIKFTRLGRCTVHSF